MTHFYVSLLINAIIDKTRNSQLLFSSLSLRLFERCLKKMLFVILWRMPFLFHFLSWSGDGLGFFVEDIMIPGRKRSKDKSPHQTNEQSCKSSKKTRTCSKFQLFLLWCTSGIRSCFPNKKAGSAYLRSEIFSDGKLIRKMFIVKILFFSCIQRDSFLDCRHWPDQVS